jgi:hypothetical protein
VPNKYKSPPLIPAEFGLLWQQYLTEAHETFAVEYDIYLYRFSIQLIVFAVPSIMVAWGTVMTLMCLVKTYHELVVYVEA